jgi:hypothetical protein
MANGLSKNRADDAVGSPLHQLPGKATAEAVPDEQKLLDTKMVHQAESGIGEHWQTEPGLFPHLYPSPDPFRQSGFAMSQRRSIQS